MYGTECWIIQKSNENTLTSTKNKILRITSTVSFRDKIRSDFIRGSLKIKQPKMIELRDKQLRWYELDT